MEAEGIILDSLLTSVRQVFKVQCSTPVEIHSIKPADPASPVRFDIGAQVRVLGPFWDGALLLCLPKPVFLGTVNRMLGESFTEIGPDNADAASELLNIIYSSGRVLMNNAGLDLKPSIPCLIRNREELLPTQNPGKVAVIACASEWGDFHLEFDLKRIAGTSA